VSRAVGTVRSSSEYDRVISERVQNGLDDRHIDGSSNLLARSSDPPSELPLPGSDQFFFDDEIVGSLVAAANRRLNPRELVKSRHRSDSKNRAEKNWDYATSLFFESGYNDEREDEVDSERIILIGVPATFSASKVGG
jgi:hypothetical protein